MFWTTTWFSTFPPSRACRRKRCRRKEGGGGVSKLFLFTWVLLLVWVLILLKLLLLNCSLVLPWLFMLLLVVVPFGLTDSCKLVLTCILILLPLPPGSPTFNNLNLSAKGTTVFNTKIIGNIYNISNCVKVNL
uniref:hypothetical protein n=1 Tax=Dichomitus squalens TaxID=114155 RepID=UPI0030021A56|nr:hypothetical protein [Dichomitus squalens]